MAQTTMPNTSTPMRKSAMCPTDFTATTPLSDVLNSEPVKRLLNQPNIIFKPIPLKNASNLQNKVTSKMKTRSDVRGSKTKSNTTILPSRRENKDEENFLPSKIKGKSEIMLVPIKRERKPCGHYEPCISIVCDVNVQQYVDRNGSSPLIATNIEEDEINAPVAKHCKNEKCDALSIDHDRCRRAVVRLHRCNQSKACDICETELHTRRCRIRHKKCTRKNEYRHNQSNGAEILKVRMREREIQMIEASKLNRKDYTDPVAVMETLMKNEELIVIPKSVSVQQQPQPPPQLHPQPQLQPQPQMQANNLNSIFGRLLPNLPFMLPQQNLVIDKSSCLNKNGVTAPIQLTMPDAINSPFIATTNSVPVAHNQYVTFTTQQGPQPFTLNDILFTQSHVMSTPIQSKPMLTPIRVVPITNLITQPSLLHQTQGVPRYCIMADPSIPIPYSMGNPQAMQIGTMTLAVANQQQTQPATVPFTLTNSLQIQPSVVPQSTVTQQSMKPIKKTDKKPTLVPRAVSKIEIPSESNSTKKLKKSPRKKRKSRKKEFKCDYCLKCFSTDWYFKMHVAMHAGKFSCVTCKQSFSSKVALKSHKIMVHKSVNSSDDKFFQCLDCPKICTNVKAFRYHRQMKHNMIVCSVCKAEVLRDEITEHVATAHSRAKNNVNKMNVAIENGNMSDETSNAENVADTGMNSLQTMMKKQKVNKMNGFDTNIEEIILEDIKIEVDDENVEEEEEEEADEEDSNDDDDDYNDET